MSQRLKNALASFYDATFLLQTRAVASLSRDQGPGLTKTRHFEPEVCQRPGQLMW